MMATQSPYEVAIGAASMAAASRPPVKSAVKSIDLSIGYTVGYGSKDHSIFPYLAVVAALYGEGRPVRLANDRYQQFQMGLKRHAFWTDMTLVVDRGTHSFSVLPNNGAGGFDVPRPELTTSTSDDPLVNGLRQPLVNELPGPIVAGHFRGPHDAPGRTRHGVSGRSRHKHGCTRRQRPRKLAKRAKRAQIS